MRVCAAVDLKKNVTLCQRRQRVSGESTNTSVKGTIRMVEYCFTVVFTNTLRKEVCDAFGC